MTNAPSDPELEATASDAGSPRPGQAGGRSAAPVFRTILRWQALAALGVAVVGGIFGLVFVGMPGVWSALVAAAIAFAFAAVTVVALLLAAGADLAWFFGIIMGSWIVKFVLFVAVLWLVKDQPWVHPVVLWACLVAAILATVAIDVVAVLRSRMPYVSDAKNSR